METKSSRDEIAEKFFDQVTKSRKEFDDADNQINTSVNKVMKAFADLAEKNPEELFGLKPSERDKFFANKLLSPEVLRALSTNPTNTSEDPLSGDITGGNPLSIAAVAEAIAKVASSEGGAKIVKEMLDFIRAEKQFMKETGKEITGWIFGGG